jgi:hypothetical protein
VHRGAGKISTIDHGIKSRLNFGIGCGTLRVAISRRVFWDPAGAIGQHVRRHVAFVRELHVEDEVERANRYQDVKISWPR